MKTITVTNYCQDKYYPRVLNAIANILDRTDVVAPVEVFIEMGILARNKYEDWQRGQIAYLEKIMQGSLGKISHILQLIGFCAHDLDMIPRQTVYNKWGKGRSHHLRFSKLGAKAVENSYEKHFLWNKSAAKKILMIAESRRSFGKHNHKTLPVTVDCCADEIVRILRTRIEKAKDSWTSIVSQCNEGIIDGRALTHVEEAIAAYLTTLSDADKQRMFQETEIGQAHQDDMFAIDIVSIEMDLEVALLEAVVSQAFFEAQALPMTPSKLRREILQQSE